MPKPLQVAFPYGDQVFSFELYGRNLVLGTAGPVQYFWMDGRELRHGRGGPNFRPCVDLWWKTVEMAGEMRVPDNEANLVLAECYPLINTARSLQDIYTDAHLYRKADREYVIEAASGPRRVRSERTYLLPEEECERLRSVTHSRDTRLIRAELEGLFLGELPPRAEMPAYQATARAWINNGIHALRMDGRKGLQRYVGTVDEWIRKQRRRGNVDRMRMFLNMFSYECKVAFYLCYCNAWIGILQWLAEHLGLNVFGERFMRHWHHQNRAADDSMVSRDAFCGQVLALHPLSAVVLTSPAHLMSVGNWIGHRDYEALLQSGQAAQCKEYWDFVSTILFAAHEYHQSKRRWEDQRRQPTSTNADELSGQVRDDSIASVRVLFEDYAAGHRHRCPKCSGPLAYVRHEATETDTSAVTVIFRCQSGHGETAILVSYDDVTHESV